MVTAKNRHIKLNKQLREEHYRAFRQHWYQLQARDFRRELQDVLK
jgi:hypothetical protein